MNSSSTLIPNHSQPTALGTAHSPHEQARGANSSSFPADASRKRGARTYPTTSNVAVTAGPAKRRKRLDGKPARALTAYNFFFSEERDRIMKERAKMDPENRLAGPRLFSAMGKEVAAAWKQLDREERKKYRDLAEQDTKRYFREVEEYRQEQLLLLTTRKNSPSARESSKAAPSNSADPCLVRNDSKTHVPPKMLTATPFEICCLAPPSNDLQGHSALQKSSVQSGLSSQQQTSLSIGKEKACAGGDACAGTELASHSNLFSLVAAAAQVQARLCREQDAAGSGSKANIEAQSTTRAPKPPSASPPSSGTAGYVGGGACSQKTELQLGRAGTSFVGQLLQQHGAAAPGSAAPGSAATPKPSSIPGLSLPNISSSRENPSLAPSTSPCTANPAAVQTLINLMRPQTHVAGQQEQQQSQDLLKTLVPSPVPSTTPCPPNSDAMQALLNLMSQQNHVMPGQQAQQTQDLFKGLLTLVVAQKQQQQQQQQHSLPVQPPPQPQQQQPDLAQNQFAFPVQQQLLHQYQIHSARMQQQQQQVLAPSQRSQQTQIAPHQQQLQQPAQPQQQHATAPPTQAQHQQFSWQQMQQLLIAQQHVLGMLMGCGQQQS